MFMQGCAGDANPFPRGEEAIARRHGSDLAQEVLRVLELKLASIRGPLTTLQEKVALPLQSKLTRVDIERIAKGRGGWRSFVANGMIETLQNEGKLPDSYSAPIALWQFGDDLTLVGLSGEVVVEYEVAGTLRVPSAIAGYGTRSVPATSSCFWLRHTECACYFVSGYGTRSVPATCLFGYGTRSVPATMSVSGYGTRSVPAPHASRSRLSQT